MKYIALSLMLLFALTGCKKSEDVKPRPIADFTYTLVSSTSIEKIYQFTNTSKYADRYQWLTPTGIASSDKHLILSVNQNARINISLTAKNDVGEDTKTQSIEVSGIATTGDVIFWTQDIGSYGDITINVDGSYQGKLTRYVTNGQSPACGREGFVTVTLSPGNHSFTAKSQGIFPLKWEGTINVARGQCTPWQLYK